MTLGQEYGIMDVMMPGGDSDMLADYFLFSGLKLAYQGYLIEQWVLPHCMCHMKMRFATPTGPDFIRATVKRVAAMSKDDAVAPDVRNFILFSFRNVSIQILTEMSLSSFCFLLSAFCFSAFCFVLSSVFRFVSGLTLVQRFGTLQFSLNFQRKSYHC